MSVHDPGGRQAQRGLGDEQDTLGSPAARPLLRGSMSPRELRGAMYQLPHHKGRVSFVHTIACELARPAPRKVVQEPDGLSRGGVDRVLCRGKSRPAIGRCLPAAEERPSAATATLAAKDLVVCGVCDDELDGAGDGTDGDQEAEDVECLQGVARRRPRLAVPDVHLRRGPGGGG